MTMFRWTPKAYIGIVKIDLGEMSRLVDSFSEEASASVQRQTCQDIQRYAQLVLENAGKAWALASIADGQEIP